MIKHTFVNPFHRSLVYQFTLSWPVIHLNNYFVCQQSLSSPIQPKTKPHIRDTITTQRLLHNATTSYKPLTDQWVAALLWLQPIKLPYIRITNRWLLEAEQQEWSLPVLWCCPGIHKVFCHFKFRSQIFYFKRHRTQRTAQRWVCWRF